MGIAAWQPMSISEGVALGLPPPEAVRGAKNFRSSYAGLLLRQLTGIRPVLVMNSMSVGLE